MPATKSLRALRKAIQNCQGCELYLRATQPVFGDGPATAPIAIIGEQPGNEEDLAGVPFVGPAGQRLDQAMQDAGLRRTDVYLTNAVKHFKWEERGRRRLHKRPSSREIKACQPWLEAELIATNAKIIFCLGAVSAQVILGSEFKLTKSRGEIIRKNKKSIIATWHPSAILRAPEKAQRDRMYRELVTDLRLAASLLLQTSALEDAEP